MISKHCIVKDKEKDKGHSSLVTPMSEHPLEPAMEVVVLEYRKGPGMCLKDSVWIPLQCECVRNFDFLLFFPDHDVCLDYSRVYEREIVLIIS